VKENSIEAYVKILEKFSNENVIYGSTVGMTLEKYKDLQLSTEHILSDYKRVLKENEKYKKAIDVVNKEKADWIRAYQEEKDKQFGFINKMSSNNLILKQEIKNKIKELNKYYKKEIYPELYSWSDLTITEHYDEMIELLQELLKGREE
jgi:bisphosphoglycerate-dependent phosphoglycerate mutase